MSKRARGSDVSEGAALEKSARELFERRFEGRKPAVVARAPGRVNLIGEHTDYSQGFCFPMAISLGTVCCIRRAPEGATESTLVSVQSEGKSATFKPGENAQEEWAKYVAGVAAQYGLTFPIEASFASDVPLGGGLSSSAALDVSFATALERLIDRSKTWDPAERALKCVEGDHTFVGVPCGIMDQFASSCCEEGKAILIDCKTNTGKLYSFDDDSVCLVVTNTNIKHSHSGGEYGSRVRECKEAAELLGVSVLRDETDPSKAEKLASETLRKRARHVISENNRVLLAAKAAETKDWSTFGNLMMESHISLRDDFEVSCKELDFIVDHALQQPGVYGSRMTGGGFGGCTVSLVQRESADNLIDSLSTAYLKRFGIECTSYVFLKPSAGAQILSE